MVELLDVVEDEFLNMAAMIAAFRMPVNRGFELFCVPVPFLRVSTFSLASLSHASKVVGPSGMTRHGP
jgi:hypothetical protein